MRPLCSLALVLLAPVAAFAQDTSSVCPKSPEIAMAISTISTVGPWLLANSAHHSGNPSPPLDGLAVAGIVFGPATGYWYANSPEWKRGVLGRAVVGAGALLLWDSAKRYCRYHDCLGEYLIPIFMGGAVIASAAQDIMRLPVAVDRANGTGADFSVLPAYSPRTKEISLTAHFTF